jgi:hypothetical protein
MVGFQMSIRLSDESAWALEKPGSRFRDCHPDKSAEEGLSSEVKALLESLGVPSDGVRVHCWVDGTECEVTAPDFVS